MNLFRVTLTSGRANRRRTEVVRADYHKVDDGILTFRCVTARGTTGYPVFIKSYAPGAWESVENQGPIE